MVISSLGAAALPESDNFMQSDSADGSGSGGGPDLTDDSDDLDGRSGSGSGNGAVITANSKSFRFNNLSITQFFLQLISCEIIILKCYFKFFLQKNYVTIKIVFIDNGVDSSNTDVIGTGRSGNGRAGTHSTTYNTQETPKDVKGNSANKFRSSIWNLVLIVTVVLVRY